MARRCKPTGRRGASCRLPGASIATGVSSACSTCALQQLRLHRVHQWLQSNAALTDPGSERRARDRQSGAAEDRFLAVQRQMIGMLGHHHLGQQSRRRDALVDDLCRHGSLYQGAAMRAGPLAAHVALDREHAWRVVELLADVFADALDRAATRAGGVLGLVVALDARQMGRQRCALGALFAASRAWRQRRTAAAASCSSMAAMSASTASSNSAFCSASSCSLLAPYFTRLSCAISKVSFSILASRQSISWRVAIDARSAAGRPARAVGLRSSWSSLAGSICATSSMCAQCRRRSRCAAIGVCTDCSQAADSHQTDHPAHRCAARAGRAPAHRAARA